MSLASISPILFESVSQVTATNSVQLGTRVKDSNGYEYVYCYNDGGVQISPGFGCIVKTGTSGFSATITSVKASAQDFIGVVKHSTATTATYFWAMTKGYANVEAPADSTITGAAFLVLDANGTFNAQSGTTGAFEPLIGMSDADVNTGSAGSFLAKIFSGF